jgi:two-component system response regulator DesR
MRILIADDQARVRFALRVLLAQQPGLELAGEASQARELLAQAEPSMPELVLLDWELPGLREVGGLAALRRATPGVRIVVLSGRVGARREALAAGADAFVSKGDPPEKVLAAVCGLMGHSVPIPTARR